MVMLTLDCSVDTARRLLDWLEADKKQGSDGVRSLTAVGGAEITATPKAAKVKGQRGRPPGKKNVAPVVQPAVIPETQPVPPKPIEQGAAQPTVADARTKLQELNAKKGMAACQKVMNNLNVPRVSELKPTEIAAFIAAVDAEINA